MTSLLLTGVGRGVRAASASYSPNPVAFDGATRLARGAALTGAVNGKQGIISAWIKMGGSDAAVQVLFGRSSTAGLRLIRGSSGRLIVQGNNAGGTSILSIQTNSTTINAAAGWKHVLASWNLATAYGKIYINGVDDTSATITLTDDTVNYATGDAGVGSYTASTFSQLTGQMMDLYVNMATSLDLSVQANREKFILGGAPVDLGADGSTPTGSAPTVLMSGALASWPTNKGAGGGMTVTAGALTAGSYP